MICWFAGTNDLSTKRLMFSFECAKSMAKSIRNYKKDNAWNIRCMVNESIVPANQRTDVLYCRLWDLTTTTTAYPLFSFL